MELFQEIRKTVFGSIFIQADELNILKLSLSENFNGKIEQNTNTLTKQFFAEFDEYVQGSRKEFTCPFKIQGTDFEKKVYEALLRIPYGESWSYKEVAEYIGNPKCSRAIGRANSRNSLPILIPCHRVISSSGKIGGYTPTVSIKEWLLSLENRKTL